MAVLAISQCAWMCEGLAVGRTVGFICAARTAAAASTSMPTRAQAARTADLDRANLTIGTDRLSWRDDTAGQRAAAERV
jgi:hypothetical protein